MHMTPAELLDRIENAKGKIALLPDGSLQCENIPEELASEVRRHAANGVLQVVLSGECDPPAYKPPLNPREARKQAQKVKRMIEREGGVFRLTDSFFQCDLPDETPTERLTEIRKLLLENAGTIYQILRPKRSSSHRKRAKCEICRCRRGCRRKGIEAQINLPTCPICGHACQSHFMATTGLDQDHYQRTKEMRMIELFPAGCGSWMTATGKRCACPGWPIETPAKSRAEILVDFVRKFPNEYTAAELAEATSRSTAWIRKTLKAADLAGLMKRNQVASGLLPFDASGNCGLTAAEQKGKQ
jgi:hypothetical protein